jgi:chemotaxis protein histidine kinase CheA/CheY-like chemotaxis protein
MSSSAASRAVDPFGGRADALRDRFLQVAPAGPESWSDLRRDLETLQSDLEKDDRAAAAEATRRIALLAEVWECLSAESAPAAAEIAEFCARALEHLASVTHEEEAIGALDWILDESQSRWSSYLGLLDEQLAPSAAEEIIDELSPPEEEPAEIDAAHLLRMLIGSASPPTSPDPEPPPARPLEPAPEPGSAPEPARPAGCGAGAGAGAGRELLEQFPSPPARVEIDPELREAFLAEASDLFDRIGDLVLGLGRQGDQSEALHELCRCFHTLKGAAGSVGLLELASLVHSLEERLSGCSTGTASDELIDLLHGGLRYLEELLEVLRQGPAAGRGPEPALAPEPSWPAAERSPAARDEKPVEESVPVPAAAAAEGPLRVPSARIDDLMDLASELITRRGLWTVQAESMKEFAGQARACRNRLMASIERFHDIGLAREDGGGAASAQDARADAPWLLRRLAEQAEDLAVLADTAQAATILMADHRDVLDRLTLQLWESLQAIRITPVRALFQRLARVAHDAARVEGRQVEVVMAGEENGLDRAVQDKAFEPMLHLVRNAVGHGIEPAADRAKANKPSAGRVTLAARREGNTLLLAVSDDGRGLDYEAIEAKGRRLGLIGPDEVPSRNRLNSLVFQSHFSTREAANAISGRGVGMDVVAQEVSRLHGTIELDSQAGRGTQFTLRLPVRLALEQVMIVRVDGQPFALPVSLVTLVQVFDPADQRGSGAETTVAVRGRDVPLIDAREALGFSTTPRTSNPKLLLVRADDDALALLVDSIDGTCELVLKPLGSLLAGHPVISGTGQSIGGEVILALNPTGMIRWMRAGAGLASTANRKATARQAPILVVDDSISVRRVVTRNLRTLGYAVEEVSNGLEALGRLRSKSYAMVLTDLEMPHLDGLELLAELGRLQLHGAVPVVVASTKNDPETRRRVLDLGARAFLTKPVESDELARLIRSLLEPPAPSTPS